VYRGVNNYQVFYEKKDTAQGNAASNSVRWVIHILCNLYKVLSVERL